MKSPEAAETTRHQCEVRHCIRMGADWFTDYIKAVAKARGKDSAQHLYDEVRAQARLGNEGAAGDWRDKEGSVA